jgi:hypothetical protein
MCSTPCIEAVRLEEECAFLRGEAATATEAAAAAWDESADLRAALRSAAELRVAVNLKP